MTIGELLAGNMTPPLYGKVKIEYKFVELGRKREFLKPSVLLGDDTESLHETLKAMGAEQATVKSVRPEVIDDEPVININIEPIFTWNTIYIARYIMESYERTSTFLNDEELNVVTAPMAELERKICFKIVRWTDEQREKCFKSIRNGKCRIIENGWEDIPIKSVTRKRAEKHNKENNTK